jgi:uncharacterized MAPEG superfamily protein
MAAELNVLLWSTVLAFVYLAVHGQLLRRQIGYAPENESRDNDPEPDLMAGRGIRAFRNLLETYPIFIALVVVTVLGERSSSLTQWGAWIWLIARAVYLPAYIIGLGRPRSAIWAVSMLGLLLMFIGIIWS